MISKIKEVLKLGRSVDAQAASVTILLEISKDLYDVSWLDMTRPHCMPDKKLNMIAP